MQTTAKKKKKKIRNKKEDGHILFRNLGNGVDGLITWNYLGSCWCPVLLSH